VVGRGLLPEFRVGEQRRGQRIRLCDAVDALLLAGELPDRFGQVLEELREVGVHLRDGRELLGPEHRRAQAEPPVDERDVERAEHALGGVGVDPEVELGGRGDVAFRVDVPAHHPHLVHEVREVGLAGVGQCEVRQRTDAQEGDLARRLAAAAGDLAGREPLGRSDAGVREQVAAEAALAVDVLGVFELLEQRLAGTLVDGDVLGVCQPERVLRVLDLVVERDVPGDDGDGFDREPVAQTREEDGLRVVARRVRVDDDAGHTGPRARTTKPLASRGGRGARRGRGPVGDGFGGDRLVRLRLPRSEQTACRGVSV